MSKPLYEGVYSRGKFLMAVVKRNRMTEREEQLASWTVRQCEMWLRMRPQEMFPASIRRTASDEEIDDAIAAAIAYVKSQRTTGAVVGFITWPFIFFIVKLVVTLWIELMFNDREAYSSVMRG